jgi:hypothetical protein
MPEVIPLRMPWSERSVPVTFDPTGVGQYLPFNSNPSLASVLNQRANAVAMGYQVGLPSTINNLFAPPTPPGGGYNPALLYGQPFGQPFGPLYSVVPPYSSPYSSLFNPSLQSPYGYAFGSPYGIQQPTPYGLPYGGSSPVIYGTPVVLGYGGNGLSSPYGSPYGFTYPGLSPTLGQALPIAYGLPGASPYANNFAANNLGGYGFAPARQPSAYPAGF